MTDDDRSLVLVGARLAPETLDALKAEAGRLDRSVSWCIRAAVDEWLGREGDK